MLICFLSRPSLQVFNVLGGLLCNVKFLTARSLRQRHPPWVDTNTFFKHTMCFLITDPNLT
jgi:hypothetical protein